MNDDYLKQKAQMVADKYSQFCNKKFGINLPIPCKLSFDAGFEDYKIAGLAYCSDLSIKLNIVLFRDNINHFLNDTIPHEIAHLVQFVKFIKNPNSEKITGHGPEWQLIMKKMGLEPKKFHTMDCSKSKQEHKKKGP